MELSSERLGITAKLDLLEGSGGGVVPVDTKKGRPARDGGPWEADAVQVCAQVLLLREHGYTVERGEIFYAETRQRVAVEVTPELVARTMRDRRRGARDRDPDGPAPAAAIRARSARAARWPASAFPTR